MTSTAPTKQRRPATPTPPGPRTVVDAADVAHALRAKPTAAFRLQSPELYELLTYGDGLVEDYKRLGIGSWNRGDDLLRAVMTYLAQRAFSIHRLPWHHDRSCAERTRQGSDLEALKFLRDVARVESVCDELRRLQRHTHEVLRLQGATHVRLRRGLADSEKVGDVVHRTAHFGGYASRVAMLAQLAQQLGRESFDMPVDVLTSWGIGGYTQYDVVIEHVVPIDAVLTFSEALASWDRSGRAALESGEWIVLNRAVDGRMRLAAKCVVKKALQLKSTEHWKPETLRGELNELGAVYGNASSMYRDLHAGVVGRVQWSARLRRAWDALTNAHL